MSKCKFGSEGYFQFAPITTTPTLKSTKARTPSYQDDAKKSKLSLLDGAILRKSVDGLNCDVKEEDSNVLAGKRPRRQKSSDQLKSSKRSSSKRGYNNSKLSHRSFTVDQLTSAGTGSVSNVSKQKSAVELPALRQLTSTPILSSSVSVASIDVPNADSPEVDLGSIHFRLDDHNQPAFKDQNQTPQSQGEEDSDKGQEGQHSNQDQPQPLDIRSRLTHLALIFTLPHLVMLSNLQKLIGVRTGKRPAIQPNEYMDNLLTSAKATMKERGLNRVELPDQYVGVALYNGRMTGLDNLTRSGDALLEAETDHFLLSFAIEASDVKAYYLWKKQRLKGEVSAVVNQVTMKMKIKQMIQNSPPPELLAFTVEKIDGIHVSIVGLGPLNWIVRRVLRSLLRRHLRDYLEREGRDVVQQELQNAALNTDTTDNLFTMLPLLVM